MRHFQRISRVSKSLAGPNRPYSNDRPAISPQQSLTAQIKTEFPQLQEQQSNTFPRDDTLFAERPLVFDTHKMINYLKAGGFSQAQSETMTEAMVRVSQHANKHHESQMVTKNEFVSLRSELSILEKADFALLKTDINSLEKRMETSVAEIYTAVERVENRVIKWVIAVAGAIGLAILRFTTPSGSAAPRIGAPPPSIVSDEDLPKQFKKDGLQLLIT